MKSRKPQTATNTAAQPERPTTLSKGQRVEFKDDGRTGRILKATRFMVHGRFDDGQPFEWTRDCFLRDFRLCRSTSAPAQRR